MHLLEDSSRQYCTLIPEVLAESCQYAWVSQSLWLLLADFEEVEH